MSDKRSGWVAGVVVLQLLYVLMLLALPAYLLILTSAPETHKSHDVAQEVYGLEIAAAVVGGPALLALVAWLGLWKQKLWGWWLTLITDMGLTGVFTYSVIDDGWHDIDWSVLALTLFSTLPAVYLLVPRVRKAYWKSGGSQLPPSAALLPPA
jgi:uncharacterized membrane protein (DUF2068 family)